MLLYLDAVTVVIYNSMKAFNSMETIPVTQVFVYLFNIAHISRLLFLLVSNSTFSGLTDSS